MRTELITIATDTVPLQGAYYEPDDGRASQGVLLFHGNTMNFYTGAPRFLPPVLTSLGLACVAFNRRGHDILGIDGSFDAVGGAFQLTQEAIDDNRYAARWMAQRGFPAPVVIGHSYGGVLGLQHACEHATTPALVLLSANRGGSHMWEAQHKRGFLAGENIDEALAAAKSKVAAGRGRDLMLVPGVRDQRSELFGSYGDDAGYSRACTRSSMPCPVCVRRFGAVRRDSGQGVRSAGQPSVRHCSRFELRPFLWRARRCDLSRRLRLVGENFGSWPFAQPVNRSRIARSKKATEYFEKI